MSREVIIHPIVSEKATRLSAAGTYIFKVAAESSAPEIKKAVQLIYKVKVVGVRVANVKPKRRRLGRSVGVRPGYRKAMVTLSAGQKLDILPK